MTPTPTPGGPVNLESPMNQPPSNDSLPPEPEPLDMSPAARWARVEDARGRWGESRMSVMKELGYGPTSWTNSMNQQSIGQLLAQLERRYALPVGEVRKDGRKLGGPRRTAKAKPAPTPPKPATVLGADLLTVSHVIKALVALLDRHSIGTPDDHPLVRLGMLSERLAGGAR